MYLAAIMCHYVREIQKEMRIIYSKLQLSSGHYREAH